jgi:hypothetical protein
LLPYWLFFTDIATLIISYPTDITTILTIYLTNLATLLITYSINLYSFLGLRHISLGFFFVKVYIVRVIINFMKKYHLGF